MPPQERRFSIDPVVIITTGVVLVSIAFILILFQPDGKTKLSSAGGTGSWSQIAVAFVTGITTGGLSCLAVQGGLLASSLAHQIEQDYLENTGRKRKRTHRQLQATRSNSALPIVLFLIAKLAAYTLLGGLLGWLGSFLALSPVTRAVLMIAIGIFMLGNALRMFNVHPVFRYFSIEPPKLITRYIRRTAKGTDTVTPLFLGALTVFIPCGVTQTIMAASLGTGSAVMGAALLFAFTLGTSPVFFVVAYLTTELGARLEKFFMRFVAAAVLVLGLVTVNSGLNLIGSPLSLNNLSRALLGPADELAAGSVSEGELVLDVRDGGYFPQTLRAAADQPVVLNLSTNETYSCARDFVIPALRFYRLLPATGSVPVNIPPQPAGTRLFFTCSMGMYTGQIIFE